MKKKREVDVAGVVRLISWIIEIILAGLFIYAYVTLIDLIRPVNIRLAITILSLPIIASFWVGCCILIALIRERWILGD